MVTENQLRLAKEMCDEAWRDWNDANSHGYQYAKNLKDVHDVLMTGYGLMLKSYTDSCGVSPNLG